jgi:hypothetical protein
MVTSTDRQHYRELVAKVAERARAILPAAGNGRVESAVKLVLQGDVTFLDDGTVQVGSSDPTRYYRLTGQACTCTEFEQGKAPEGWCKHRIAAGIHKRVAEMLAESMRAADTAAETMSPAPLPEAPASVNVRLTIGGREVQVTLRDSDETRLLKRLEALQARYPMPQAPVQASSTAAGWCSIHAAQMTLNEKAGRTWYSHKTPQGWCKGR